MYFPNHLANTAKVVDFGTETLSLKNFFTDIIATVGSIDFTQNGRYVVSREYLNVKIWDLANTRKPLHNICVQETLKSKLVNLFESDSIYDKFNIACSRDSGTVVTGNYNNLFHLMDVGSGANTQYELSFKKNTVARAMVPGRCPPVSKLDTRRKTSAVAFHPFRDSVAVASLNCFFIYSL
jgi:serine/threonine-protein phosphatase 2A regulatory subunit B